MIWLFKKIFGLGVVIAIVFFALHIQVGGRPAKDYLSDFFRSPLVQEAWRQGKGAVLSYLQKDVTPAEDAVPMEQLDDDERKELENILKEKSR